MRKPQRPDRETRRALAQDTPTSEAVKRLQGQRIARWSKDDAERIALQAERIGHVRTLRNDEQAKAHSAPSQAVIIHDNAKLNAHAEGIEESRKDFLIPRRALTVKLHLALVRPLLEMEDRVRRDLTVESRKELERNQKLVAREHPALRPALAAKLNAAFVPQFTEGTDSFMVWRSDKTLLDAHRLIGSTITTQRQTRNGRTYERDSERELLPTWTDADGRVVDPNNGDHEDFEL